MRRAEEEEPRRSLRCQPENLKGKEQEEQANEREKGRWKEPGQRQNVVGIVQQGSQRKERVEGGIAQSKLLNQNHEKRKNHSSLLLLLLQVH